MAGIYQSSFTGSEIDNIVSSSLLGVNVNGTPASITNRIAEINIPEYSSGIWNPTAGNYGANSSSPVISLYTRRSGHYVRFGRLCYINFNLQFTLLSSGNGYAMIETLPFAASSSITKQSITLCELGSFKNGSFRLPPDPVPAFHITGENQEENKMIKIQKQNGIYGMQWQDDGPYEMHVSGSGVYEIQI